MAKIPTETRRVMAPGPIGVVAPTGHLAEARTAQVVGQVSGELNQSMFAVVAEDAKRNADREVDSYVFQRDPVSGRVIPPEVPNINGEAIPSIYDVRYSKGLMNRYQHQVLDSADTELNNIATKNINNPDGWLTESAAYRDKLLAHVPEDQKGLFDTAISRMAVPYTKSINNNHAKQAHIANQKAVARTIDRYVSDYENMMASGGTAQNELVMLDRIGKTLDSALLDGTFNENEHQAYTHLIEARGAYSSMAIELTGSGTSPGSELGQARFTNAIRGTLDGDHEIMFAGRKRKISDVLSSEERSVVAQQLGVLQRHYKTLDGLYETMNTDMLLSQHVIPALIKAKINGERPDVKGLTNTLAKLTNDPKTFMSILSAISSADSQAVGAQVQMAAHVGIKDAANQLQVSFDSNAAMRDAVAGMLEASGEGTPEQVLSTARAMNANENYPGAKAELKKLEDRIVNTGSMKLSKEDQAMLQLGERHERIINNKLAAAAKLEGEAQKRAIADAYATPFPSEATKKQKFAWAGNVKNFVEAQLVEAGAIPAGESVNYASVEPQDIANQIMLTQAYATSSVYGSEFLDTLKHTIGTGWDVGNPQQMEAKLNLFREATATRNQRIALQEQMDDKTFTAYDKLNKQAGFVSLADKALYEDIQNLIDPDTPFDEFHAQQNSDMVHAAFSNPNSEAADDLSSEATKFIYGDTNNMWGDQLRADSRLLRFMKSRTHTLTGIYSGDSDLDDAVDNAMVAARRNAVESYSVASADRSAALFQQGWIDSMGRKNPPKQWVPNHVAPEGLYPSNDPNNPGAVMTAFVLYAETIAREAFPGEKLYMGVNLAVELSEDLTGNVGPMFRLVRTDEFGQQIYAEGNEGVVNFNPIYQKILSGTLKNLEQLADMDNARQIITNTPNRRFITLEQTRLLDAAIKKLEEPVMPEFFD